MRKKETAIQRAATDVGLDTSLQDLLDDVEDELLVIDSDYRVKFANSVACGKLQKGPKSPIGRLCYQVFQGRDKPCGAPLWDCPLRKVIESGSMTTVIHPERILDTEKYLKITAYPLRDSHGNTGPLALAILKAKNVTPEADFVLRWDEKANRLDVEPSMNASRRQKQMFRNGTNGYSGHQPEK